MVDDFSSSWIGRLWASNSTATHLTKEDVAALKKHRHIHAFAAIGAIDFRLCNELDQMLDEGKADEVNKILEDIETQKLDNEGRLRPEFLPKDFER